MSVSQMALGSKTPFRSNLFQRHDLPPFDVRETSRKIDVGLRSADGKEKLLDDTIKAYRDALQLTQDRFEGGLAASSDVTQAAALRILQREQEQQHRATASSLESLSNFEARYA